MKPTLTPSPKLNNEFLSKKRGGGKNKLVLAITLAVAGLLTQFNEAFYNIPLSQTPGAITLRDMTPENRELTGELIDLLREQGDANRSLKYGTTFRVMNPKNDIYVQGLSQRIPKLMEAGGVQVLNSEMYDANGDGSISNDEMTVALQAAIASL